MPRSGTKLLPRLVARLGMALLLGVPLGRAQVPAGAPAAGSPPAASLPVASIPPIPLSEALEVPTAARLERIAATCAPVGWTGALGVLREAALRAYSANRLAAAEGWFNAYRLASLFAEPEPSFIPDWIQAVQSAKALHANMQMSYTPPDSPLGARMSAGSQRWLFRDQRITREFLGLLSPVDYLPEVLAILDRIHRAQPEWSTHYSSLALAIAVVYDVPPPPTWPHGQVKPGDLPRTLPPAEKAFQWWASQDDAGRTYHHLAQVPADQLKFVVDALASFGDLEWSQQVVNYPLSQFERTYPMIRYRHDRGLDAVPVWMDGPYTLPTILAEGGICVDQAYFAVESGKARGIPTLLFYGAGRDGRHAWFGFLDGQNHWKLDAGRYAEQRLETGNAVDPQTWTEISDHELKFLSEGFRLLPTFGQSRIHEAFAKDFFAAGNLKAAAWSAMKATDYEPRNLSAWTLRLQVADATRMGYRDREALLRAAARAFASYPDLEIQFVKQIAASLRARGEASLGDMEERTYLAKTQGSREDITVAREQEVLVRAMGGGASIEDQIRTYTAIVDQYGPGSGAGLFDRIVVVFVEHLILEGKKDEARQALDHARQVIEVKEGTQLEADMNRLVARIDES